MNDAFLFLLGGLLAAGAGILAEEYRGWAMRRRGRTLYVTAICDDLEQSERLYDQIRDEWAKTGQIWFATIDEMSESRAFYYNNRDALLYLEDQKLRRQVFQYYTKSSATLSLLRNYQQTAISFAAGGGRLDPTQQKISDDIVTRNLAKLPEYKSEAKLLLGGFGR